MYSSSSVLYGETVMDYVAIKIEGYQDILRISPYTRTYIVGTHQKRLAEALLMCTTIYVYMEKPEKNSCSNKLLYKKKQKKKNLSVRKYVLYVH